MSRKRLESEAEVMRSPLEWGIKIILEGQADATMPPTRREHALKHAFLLACIKRLARGKPFVLCHEGEKSDSRAK